MKWFYVLITIIVFFLAVVAWVQISQKILKQDIFPTPSIKNTTASITPSTSSTVTTQAPKTSKVKIFLIAVSDNGKSGEKIGCGDSVVAVVKKITPTTMLLTASLKQLLGLKTQFYGESGLYNALYQSDITLESAVVKNGTATVKLSGNLKLGGVCDDPRVEAQITQTILQFPTVSKVNVYINGVLLHEALSEK